MKNKTGWIVGGIIAAIILIVVIMAVSSYNSLVTNREKVSSSYAAIDTQLQRRSDLIPNLVQTVKGYNVHEAEVIASVTDARAKLGGAQDASTRLEAETELSGALSRLLVVVENYPDLKADANFQQLMDELSGTENRITVARNDYNQTVQSYNTKIKTFPGSIFAGMFGFEAAPYFEASEESKSAPVVDFGA